MQILALPWAFPLLLELLVQEAAAQSCLIPRDAFNAALGRPAIQSSLFPNISIAANAVDGNRDGIWDHGSCSRTLWEREPWWSVDLGGIHTVEAVVVKNRQDCCWDQLHGAQIHVGDAPGERGRLNPICGIITDAGPGSLSTVCCHGIPGRFVSIVIPGRSEALVLCEVEVVLQGCAGIPGAPNVALGRSVSQSSTPDASGLAAHAVDGNRDGSCSHTEKDPEPWWRVDLGLRSDVYAVAVTNRRDCCWERLLGAQIHVGDSLEDHGKRNPVCGVILETGPGSTSTVCCGGIPGRYVSIVIPGREEFLVLCEVEVTAQSCAAPPGAQNLALRRPAAQSSTSGRSSSAGNAVDGNGDGMCSQTEREWEPWWMVDLGRSRSVAAVVLWNRRDCCWHRLKGARIHLGDSLAGHGTDNPVCGTITDTAPGSASSVCCRGRRGRYVTVAIPGRSERLSLCQVEVLEQGCTVFPRAQNVALGHPAVQSSVLDAGSGAGKAVDGNRDGDWEHGSCSHTDEEPEPWWRVDLGHRHRVHAVVVKNRRDCCWERLKGAQIHVGDSLVDHGKRNPVCGIITEAGPGSLSTVCCHGIPGRFVSIVIPEREEALALCEVEVIRQGCSPLPGAPNLARDQRATQSSTSNGAGIAAKAVDGNRDGVWDHGSCSHTRREREPWWSVDLGGIHAVEAVVVKNRQDCCWDRLRGAQIHVGDAPGERGRLNPICGIIPDPGPGSISTVCCHGIPGRFVSVIIPGREEALALCEVEVYGAFPES